MKNKSLYHWLMVASCCCLATASIGLCFNVSGIFYSVMADSLGVGRGIISMSATMTNATAGLLSLAFVPLMKKMGPKKLFCSGILLTAFSTAMLGTVRGLVSVYIYSILRGVGIVGFGNVMISTMMNNWFKERNGFATSLAFCFSGVGGAVFNPIFSALIESVGWRNSYYIMGVCILIIALPVTLFVVHAAPEEKNLLPYGATREDVAAKKAAIAAAEADKKAAKGMTLRIIRNPAFLMTFAYTVLVCYVTGLGQHFSGMAESVHMTAAAGAMMVSMAMVGNIAFKLIIGILTDATNAMKAGMLLMAANLISLICLLFLGETSSILAMAAPFFYGTSYAVAAVGSSLVTRAVASPEEYGRAIGITTMLSCVGGAIPLAVLGFLYDCFGNYDIAVYSCVVCAALCIVLLFFIDLSCKKRKKHVSIGKVE